MSLFDIYLYYDGVVTIVKTFYLTLTMDYVMLNEYSRWLTSMTTIWDHATTVNIIIELKFKMYQPMYHILCNSYVYEYVRRLVAIEDKSFSVAFTLHKILTFDWNGRRKSFD